MWQVIYNITKKWWDRHKDHGSDRTPVPVWPNVRQKKKFSPTLVIVTCWFLVVYGFDKSTWTWSGKTVLFGGRSWKSPPEHQRRCHRLKNNMNSKDHCLLSSTGSPIALGYGMLNKWCILHTAKNSLRTKLGLGSKNIFGLVCTDSV